MPFSLNVLNCDYDIGILFDLTEAWNCTSFHLINREFFPRPMTPKTLESVVLWQIDGKNFFS